MSKFDLSTQNIACTVLVVIFRIIFFFINIKTSNVTLLKGFLLFKKLNFLDSFHENFFVSVAA